MGSQLQPPDESRTAHVPAAISPAPPPSRSAHGGAAGGGAGGGTGGGGAGGGGDGGGADGGADVTYATTCECSCSMSSGYSRTHRVYAPGFRLTSNVSASLTNPPRPSGCGNCPQWCPCGVKYT